MSDEMTHETNGRMSGRTNDSSSCETSRARSVRGPTRVWPALLLCLTTALLATAWTTAPRAALSPRAAPAPPVPGEPVPVIGRAWPVGLRPPVVRAWEPPPPPVPGSPPGRVAGRGVVTVELTGTGDPPLRTTYEPVRASVRKGAEVSAGALLGTLEPAPSHCPTACLHWGLRRAETYLDPLSLMPPWLLHRGPSRLLPVPR
ncbi:M23 family metallopeptidase [Streptomyces scabiei]|uniref:M23 family peptidase n=1 Tax=Streptomyces scabiei TaxID=1930 RepID=UPI0029AF21C2|nr:M23 family peptidase [Streptomyces scabiei]MDX3124735.1 M23 family peptidase [Streptomyces scabiei]